MIVICCVTSYCGRHCYTSMLADFWANYDLSDINPEMKWPNEQVRNIITLLLDKYYQLQSVSSVWIQKT
jgi:hypothetical protein